MKEQQIQSLMYFCETIGREICAHTARQILHAREILLRCDESGYCVHPEHEAANRIIKAFGEFLKHDRLISDDLLFALPFQPTEEELAARENA